MNKSCLDAWETYKRMVDIQIKCADKAVAARQLEAAAIQDVRIASQKLSELLEDLAAVERSQA